MNLDEVRANRYRMAVWRTPDGRARPARILYVIEGRVWVRLEPLMSEKDVAPEDLSLT